MARRPSAQTMSVLQALAADAAVWRHGYELGQEIGLKAGSLYPILMRLSDRGLLESTWEREMTSGRPPRHLYRLTTDGIAYAAEYAIEDAPDRQRTVRPSARIVSTTSARILGATAARIAAGGVR